MATLDTIHLVGRYTFLWKTQREIGPLPARIEAVTTAGNKVTYEVVGDLPEGLVLNGNMFEGAVESDTEVLVRAHDGVTRVTRRFLISGSNTPA